MAEKFVNADLDFESWVTVGAIEFVIGLADEGDGFVGCFGTQYIA